MARLKKPSVREIEVAPYSEGDDAATADRPDAAGWLRKSLLNELGRRLTNQRKARKRGGAITGAKKKAQALTAADFGAAEQSIKNRGERVTAKRLAKELGGKSPDYIRKRRKRT